MPGTAMAVLLLLVGKSFILYLFRSDEIAKVMIAGVGVPLLIIVLLVAITLFSLLAIAPIFIFRLMPKSNHILRDSISSCLGSLSPISLTDIPMRAAQYYYKA